MASYLNERLIELQQDIARLRKVDAILSHLQSERDTRLHQKKRLNVILEKENTDVRKLEGKSITGVFYSILGKLDERLQKEKEEVLAAALKYEQAEKDLADIQKQIDELSLERLNYLDCQKEFDRLYAQKKEELVRENGVTAQRLLELDEEIHYIKIQSREIDEAIGAGEEALVCLGRVGQSLDSAAGWGTFDMLGGGLVSDLVKHSHINDAKADMEEAQEQLRRFSTEMADVNMGKEEFAVTTQGFAKFADFFFDGLIADWYMQSQINKSQDNVAELESQVSDALNRLQEIKAQGNGEIEELEEKVRELVMQGE